MVKFQAEVRTNVGHRLWEASQHKFTYNILNFVVKITYNKNLLTCLLTYLLVLENV